VMVMRIKRDMRVSFYITVSSFILVSAGGGYFTANSAALSYKNHQLTYIKRAGGKVPTAPAQMDFAHLGSQRRAMMNPKKLQI
jgi:hypothetical protein